MAIRRRRRAKRGSGLAGTILFLLTLFVATCLLRTFVVAPFMIPSGSMEPGLTIGDYLFAAKWPYGYSRYAFPFGMASFRGRLLAAAPRRGDIVVFRYPGDGQVDYVKRLIGLPGDRIQMRAGWLILNGKTASKVRIADWLMKVTANSPCRTVGDYHPAPVVRGDGAFCRYPRYRETLPGGRAYEILDQIRGSGDDTPLFIVPPGHYFVMGDNRDDSADSRFALARKGVGMLPGEDLIGRPLILFFSTDGSARWLKPWTWFQAARWNRIGHAL